MRAKIVDAAGNPLDIDPAQLERVHRADRWVEDRWENPLTGIGTWTDKTTGGRFLPSERVMDQEIRALRDGSDIVGRVIEDRPKEAFREGYELVGRIRKEKKSGSPTDAATDVQASDVEAMREFAEEEMSLDDTIMRGAVEGRCWGGALDIMLIDDGQFPWQPLDEDKIRTFDGISLVDRRYAYVQAQYSGIQQGNGKKYGAAEMYLIANAIAGTGWAEMGGAGTVQKKSRRQLENEGAQIQFVHESRCLRFDGVEADVQTRQRLAGWSWSVVQRLYQVLRQFEHAFDSVGYLLADASQAVFKLHGLAQTFKTGNVQAVQMRAEIMERTRSVAHGVFLDKEEEFQREQTPFGGIPDLLDRFMMRFAAGADTPCSRLFGRAPAGLNATGESETRAWYDSVRAEAQKKVAPRLKRVYRLLALAQNSPLKGKKVDWQVEFKPLWSPTDKEVADTLFTNAQRDNLYFEIGAASADEIALTLRDVYPNLDFAAREAAIKAKVPHDPHENEEPDPHENEEPDPNAGVGEPLGEGAPQPILGPAENPEGAGAKHGEQPPGKKPKTETVQAKSTKPGKTNAGGASAPDKAVKAAKRADAPAYEDDTDKKSRAAAVASKAGDHKAAADAHFEAAAAHRQASAHFGASGDTTKATQHHRKMFEHLERAGEHAKASGEPHGIPESDPNAPDVKP